MDDTIGSKNALMDAVIVQINSTKLRAALSIANLVLTGKMESSEISQLEVNMTDEDVRNLEREVAANPDDGQLKLRLLMSRSRSNGQKFTTYWKLRDKTTGHFSNGRWVYWLRKVDLSFYFTDTGKQWTNKNTLLKFIKKSQAKDSTTYGKEYEPFWKVIKNCEIVEFHSLTVEAEVEELDSQLEKFELELLREEKEANLKKVREIEAKEKKLLAKQSEVKS